MTSYEVKIVTVVTGEIKTNFFINTLRYKLPPNSVYMPIEKKIAVNAWGKGLSIQIKAEFYADKAVADVLEGVNGKMYRAKTASTVRFIFTFFSTFLLVS